VTDDWQQRVDRLWSSFDPEEAGPFVSAMTRLAAERPEEDPDALFELGGAHDATDSPHEAIRLYRRALAAGLPHPRARQATIQLASSLRVIGQPAEAVALLEEELSARGDELDDAARAFLALALNDLGRGDDALALLLRSLAPHLPQYGRSVRFYADALGRRPNARPSND
jgi:tetratricopeptide (TPR) repeat protein